MSIMLALEGIDAHFVELDALIDQHRGAGLSFSQVVLQCDGLLSLKRWAIQKYHQTYLQNVVFSAIHCNTQVEEVRQLMVGQLIGEETAVRDGTDAHYNLMKRFALACGATEVEIAQSEPDAPVLEFVNYLIQRCKWEPFPLALLAIYVNERQTPSASIRTRDVLKQRFGFADEVLEWFDLHGLLDIDHANEGREVIIKYYTHCPEFFNRSREVVEVGARAWSTLQNYYCNLLKEEA